MNDPSSVLDTALSPAPLAAEPTLPATIAPPPAHSPNDGMRYGWRYVRQSSPDGTLRWIKVPLTREDVLHPQEGDHILNNDPHQVNCIYVYSVFKSQLQSDPTAVVFQDTGVYWEDPVLDHHSPDVTVIKGVKEQKKWTSFKVAEERVRPELIVEVTSPSTYAIDTEDKLQEYAQAKVPRYLLVLMEGRDEEATVGALTLNQLTPNGYVEIPPDERGWHWLETVGVWVGVENGQVQCYRQDAVGSGATPRSPPPWPKPRLVRKLRLRPVPKPKLVRKLRLRPVSKPKPGRVRPKTRPGLRIECARISRPGFASWKRSCSVPAGRARKTPVCAVASPPAHLRNRGHGEGMFPEAEMDDSWVAWWLKYLLVLNLIAIGGLLLIGLITLVERAEKRGSPLAIVFIPLSLVVCAATIITGTILEPQHRWLNGLVSVFVTWGTIHRCIYAWRVLWPKRQR